MSSYTKMKIVTAVFAVFFIGLIFYSAADLSGYLFDSVEVTGHVVDNELYRRGVYDQIVEFEYNGNTYRIKHGSLHRKAEIGGTRTFKVKSTDPTYDYEHPYIFFAVSIAACALFMIPLCAMTKSQKDK